MTDRPQTQADFEARLLGADLEQLFAAGALPSRIDPPSAPSAPPPARAWASRLSLLAMAACLLASVWIGWRALRPAPPEVAPISAAAGPLARLLEPGHSVRLGDHHLAAEGRALLVVADGEPTFPPDDPALLARLAATEGLTPEETPMIRDLTRWWALSPTAAVCILSGAMLLNGLPVAEAQAPDQLAQELAAIYKLEASEGRLRLALVDPNKRPQLPNLGMATIVKWGGGSSVRSGGAGTLLLTPSSIHCQRGEEQLVCTSTGKRTLIVIDAGSEAAIYRQGPESCQLTIVAGKLDITLRGADLVAIEKQDGKAVRAFRALLAKRLLPIPLTPFSEPVLRQLALALRPLSQAQRERFDALLADLGDKAYKTRQAASNQLAQLANADIRILTRVTQATLTAKEAEVSARLRAIHEQSPLAKIAKIIDARNLDRDLDVLLEVARRDAADRAVALARIKALLGYAKGQFMSPWTSDMIKDTEAAAGSDQAALAFWTKHIAEWTSQLRWNADKGRYDVLPKTDSDR